MLVNVLMVPSQLPIDIVSLVVITVPNVHREILVSIVLIRCGYKMDFVWICAAKVFTKLMVNVYHVDNHVKVVHQVQYILVLLVCLTIICSMEDV